MGGRKGRRPELSSWRPDRFDHLGCGLGRPYGGLVEPWIQHASRIRRASCALHEREGLFRVHAGNDEPEMAGVAGESAIADAAHAVPSLHHGGVSALYAAADARHQELNILCQAPSGYGAERATPRRRSVRDVRASPGTPGRCRPCRRNSLARRPGPTLRPNGSHAHWPRSLGLPHKPADFIHRQMRLVAEIGFLAFIVTRASGSRGLTPPPS
jgi:hypothetical protein